MANFDLLQISDLLVHDGGVIPGLWLEGLRSAQDDGPETVAELLDLTPDCQITGQAIDARLLDDAEAALTTRWRCPRSTPPSTRPRPRCEKNSC